MGFAILNGYDFTTHPVEPEENQTVAPLPSG